MVLARLLPFGLPALVQRSWSAHPAKILRDGPVNAVPSREVGAAVSPASVA
jgi:hypothetical protein